MKVYVLLILPVFWTIHSANPIVEKQWSRHKFLNCSVTNSRESMSSFVAGLLDNENICLNDTRNSMEHSLVISTMICSLDNTIKKENTSKEVRDEFLRPYLWSYLKTHCDSSLNCTTLGTQSKYCNFVEFLFLKQNKLRLDVCQAIEERTQKDKNACNSVHLRSWYDRCTSLEGNDAYRFSWNFLVMAFKNTTVLEEFDNAELNKQDWASTMSREILSNPRFTSVFSSVSEVYILSSNLFRKLMTTTLMLNNFGRSVRQTQAIVEKHCHNNGTINGTHRLMQIKCDPRDLPRRDKYDVSYKDLWFLRSMENFRCIFLLILIVLGLISNVYMSALLRTASQNINLTSVQLLCAFVAVNLMFLFMNAWLLGQQFFPIIKENQKAEFFEMENYNGDRFENATFFAAASSLRLMLNNRYHENPDDFKESGTTMAVHFVLILEDIFLSLSRSLAATVLILIIYLFLYELRASLCGRISKVVLHRIKAAFLAVLSLLLLMYSAIAFVEFKAIQELNRFLNDKPQNQKELNQKCSKIIDQESRIFLFKLHPFFMASFYAISVVLITSIFIYHRFKLQRLRIPLQSVEEMKSALSSLAFASFVYILANFGTTYIEISAAMHNCLESTCISDVTLKYNWLFLLSLVDPILHPLIIIRRIRAMRKLDQEWRSNFGWRSILPRPKYRVEPEALHYRKNPPTMARPTSKRTNFSANRELLSMLRFLEEQRSPKLDETQQHNRT